jgi:hypothetical protein
LEFVTGFLQRLLHNTPNIFYSSSCKNNAHITPSIFYKYLAIYIRIQALHNTHGEGENNPHLFQTNIKEAIHHFQEQFPDYQCLGLHLVELLHARAIFGKEEEENLSQVFQNVVDYAGQ